MGFLTEARLDDLVRGCPSCGGTRLQVRAYLDGRFPLMVAEPTGDCAWVYDGEKFVDGVFEVSCAGCRHVLFTSDACPRCNADGGLRRALAEENRWPVPRACTACKGREVLYTSFVPTVVSYEGKKIARPEPAAELGEVGFHGVRAECPDCGVFAEQTERCPLCDAPGPLRERP
jgi:hypothetical protein